MELTPTQEDGLTEFLNIAFGRAAGALSILTDQRVLVNVPSIGLYPISELTANLARMVGDEVAIVSQVFSGAVKGNAVLLMGYPEAVRLSKVFARDQSSHTFLNASDREALTEIGNILLNACLSTLGNILQVHISFTVPRLHIEGVEGLMHSLTVDQSELRYCMVISSTFKLHGDSIFGYLVVVMGVSSLDRLIQAVDELTAMTQS